jgi:hypothetical protein
MAGTENDRMDADDGLVWYADSDDPYDTLRHSGGLLFGIMLIPFLLAVCASASHPGPGVAWVLLTVGLVPFGAGVFALWEYLGDRRAVVELRLDPPYRPNRLTVVRANRSTTTYPFAALTRVTATRSVVLGTAHSSTLRLYLTNRLERTRRGPADLPERWRTALAEAGVPVDVHDEHPYQQRVRYRRIRPWRPKGRL